MVSSVNAAAASALGCIKDKRAVEPLKNAVVHGSSLLSHRALMALWEIEGNNLELFYLDQLKHSCEETRHETVWILGQLGKPDYIEILISISQDDSSYDVQSNAIHVLSTIGTKEALEAVEYWNKYRRQQS
jgi:HEAT repeat protein